MDVAYFHNNPTGQPDLTTGPGATVTWSAQLDP